MVFRVPVGCAPTSSDPILLPLTRVDRKEITRLSMAGVKPTGGVQRFLKGVSSHCICVLVSSELQLGKNFPAKIILLEINDL